MIPYNVAEEILQWNDKEINDYYYKTQGFPKNNPSTFTIKNREYLFFYIFYCYHLKNKK